MLPTLPPVAVTIRRAVVGDAAVIAALHMAGWSWAYRGLLPDAFLDGLGASVERRAARRREMLARDDDGRIWIAEVGGRPVGFAETGPCRDADVPPGAAELSTLYLEQAAAGRGIGRRLLAHAIADLRQRGYRVATLWVLAGNRRARRFYAAAGWAPDGTTRMEQWSGVELEGVRYRTDLAAPAGPTGRCLRDGEARPG